MPAGILHAYLRRRKLPAVLVAKMADGRRIRYLNINARLADSSGRLYDGMMNPGDKLHPILAGYQVWADALKPILEELPARANNWTQDRYTRLQSRHASPEDRGSRAVATRGSLLQHRDPVLNQGQRLGCRLLRRRDYQKPLAIGRRLI